MTFCWVSSSGHMQDFLDFLVHPPTPISPTKRSIKVTKCQKLRAQLGDCSAICLQSLMVILRSKWSNGRMYMKGFENCNPCEMQAAVGTGVGCQQALTIKHWGDQQRLALLSYQVAIHLSLAQLSCYLLLEMPTLSSGPGILWFDLWKQLDLE